MMTPSDTYSLGFLAMPQESVIDLMKAITHAYPLYWCELGELISVDLFVGFNLIKKRRLDREAEERRKISKKYERWIRGDYMVEERQDKKTEE